MQEVSDRLFLNKLTKRAEEGRTDFESLVKLVEEHKNEMKGKFKL
jgi:RNAse (barnase) inhibitor barstar